MAGILWRNIAPLLRRAATRQKTRDDGAAHGARRRDE